MGWIGVDLDGTLAGWGEGHPVDVLIIGPPIPRMVEVVKAWLAEGREVRIVTARVGPASDAECAAALEYQTFAHCEALNLPSYKYHENAQAYWDRYQRALIEAWCAEHLGQILPITATKDFHMEILYDDRAVQIITNRGCTVLELQETLRENRGRGSALRIQ